MRETDYVLLIGSCICNQIHLKRICFWNTSIGRWFYDKLGNRPYGSMYINEMTPDGFRINTEGVWEVK